jgi:hypothetical protein
VLLPHEMDLKHCLNVWLIQLLREEEIEWYQRSKSNKLLHVDSNTKYFHLVANGKNRKTWISQLDEDRHSDIAQISQEEKEELIVVFTGKR